MIIRKMIIEDYEGVYNLWINTPGMGLNNLDDSKEGIEKYLKRNPTTCFVAEKDNEIVGVILSGNDGRRGYIHHTAVFVPDRKSGIGSALVDAAMKALKEEGINKVALVAFSKNEIGNSFWEKRGFEAREDLIYRNKTINKLTPIVHEAKKDFKERGSSIIGDNIDIQENIEKTAAEESVENKAAMYDLLCKQLSAFVEDEKHVMPNLANASALLWDTLTGINWAGFYLMTDGYLLLGPFQGKPACIRISVGKGVCGTAVSENSTQLIEDVHKFPGHIACDSASNSEIVIPIRSDGKVIGVLDIDSPIFSRFDEQDKLGLESFVEILQEACQWDE